jgi:hypothetical protein
MERNSNGLSLRRIFLPRGLVNGSAPTYNADADVPMTEADLSPLLSKPTPDGKKDNKDKDGKKNKKRSRKEMEDEEDQVDETVVEQSKSNGVEESAETKKEKSKDKHDKKDKVISA